MGTFTGKCRYCGEEINIIAESQEDTDRQASRDCSCGGYQREQQIAERKEHMTGALMALIAPGCERQNFRPLQDETCNRILHIGRMVVDGEIQQARISVDGTVIAIKGGEKIKVTRSMKYEQGENI